MAERRFTQPPKQIHRTQNPHREDIKPLFMNQFMGSRGLTGAKTPFREAIKPLFMAHIIGLACREGQVQRGQGRLFGHSPPVKSSLAPHDVTTPIRQKKRPPSSDSTTFLPVMVWTSGERADVDLDRTYTPGVTPELAQWLEVFVWIGMHSIVIVCRSLWDRGSQADGFGDELHWKIDLTVVRICL